MNFKQLMAKLANCNINALTVIWVKKEMFGTCVLFAKGSSNMELASSMVTGVTTLGTKGVFELKEL